MKEETPTSGSRDERRGVLRATGVVGGATLVSRIFGYIRDMVVAYLFGAGAATDAFFLAFRIPNTLRRLFAEGALTIAFIPVFTEHLARSPREDAETLGRSTGTATFIALALLTLAGIGLAPWIVKIFAYGFTYDPGTFDLAVSLTRIVFPYILLVGIVAWAMGILNSFKQFFAPAFAPVLLNLGMIGSALLLRGFFPHPIFALAAGVILGGILQILLQIPFLSRTGMRFRGKVTLLHPGLKRIALLMLPAMFGLAVYQLNVLMGTLLASFLPRGSITYLYYADRVVEAPLGIFAIALATAVLPTMSEKTAQNDIAGLKSTLRDSVSTLLFLIVPATFALVVLRVPIINVLFEHGEFTADSTRLTASALGAYALGLVAFSGVRVVVPTFYSLKDTRTPVRVALISFIANLTFSLALMDSLKHVGLALATSLSAGLNLVLLLYLLRRRIGDLDLTSLIPGAVKMLVASVIMSVVVGFVSGEIDWDASTGLFTRIAVLTGSVGLGMAVYFLFSYLLRVDELRIFRQSFLKRKN